MIRFPLREQTDRLTVFVIDLLLVDNHITIASELGSLLLDRLEIDLSAVDLKHDLAGLL